MEKEVRYELYPTSIRGINTITTMGCYPSSLPCGSVEDRFEILSTPFSKTIYWEGGVVSIGKREYRVDLTYLPLLVVPPSLVGAYQLYKRRGRRAPLVITSTTPQPQLTVTPQPAVVQEPVAQPVEEVAPESMPRVPTPPPAKRVIRSPSGGAGRVEVREESKRRRPTKFRSIADVLMKTRVEEE